MDGSLANPLMYFTYMYLMEYGRKVKGEAAAVYSQLLGQSRVKDLNNDGKISTPEDRTIIGQRDPEMDRWIFYNSFVQEF